MQAKVDETQVKMMRTDGSRGLKLDSQRKRAYK